MKRCPNCGAEMVRDDGKPIYQNSTLSKQIMKRLDQYGFDTGNSPEKHSVRLAVRKVIKMFVPGIPGGNRQMSEATYEAALAELNRLLPDKEATS